MTEQGTQSPYLASMCANRYMLPLSHTFTPHPTKLPTQKKYGLNFEQSGFYFFIYLFIFTFNVILLEFWGEVFQSGISHPYLPYFLTLAPYYPYHNS